MSTGTSQSKSNSIAAAVLAPRCESIEDDGVSRVVRVDRYTPMVYVLEWRPEQTRVIDRLTTTTSYRQARRFVATEVPDVLDVLRILRFDPVELRDFSL